MVHSDKEIKELISFCLSYRDLQIKDGFLIRFGHKSIEKQNFWRNEYRFRELKYIQLAIVLSSKTAFLSKEDMESLKDTYHGEYDEIRKQQLECLKKGFKKKSIV